MIKKFIFLFVILLALFAHDSYAYNQNFSFRTKKIPKSIASPEKRLKIGETLEYSMEWFGFQAGKIILKVEGLSKINSQECYHITAKAMPNNFFKAFYDIEYTVHTYFDLKNMRPLRFAKDRRINKAVNEVTADFDWKKRIVKFVSKGEAPKMIVSKDRANIEAAKPLADNIRTNTQDLLSSLYYFRLMDIKTGDVYTIDIYYNQRVWPLTVKISAPFKKDWRKLGSFDVFGISPYSQLADVIMGNRKMIIYFTIDSDRIPLEFRLSTGIGPMSGKLIKLPD